MRGVQPATAVRVALIVVLLALAAPPLAAAATFDFGLQDCECHGIGVGADGSIYVGDGYRDRLVKFSPSGSALTSFFRPAGADTRFAPGSTAAAPGGNLVVADGYGAMLITPQGAFVRRLSTGSSSDVAVDAAGFAYLPDGRHSIEKVSVAGGPAEVWDDPASGWINVTGITYDAASGHLFIVDRSTSKVTELRTDGTVVRSFGGVGTGPGELLYPTDVVVAPDGAIYVSESSYRGARPINLVKRFDRTGTETGSYDFGWNDAPEALALSGDYLLAAKGLGVRAVDLVRPTVNFVPHNPQPLAGALVRFDAAGYSSLPFGTITSFDWDFDGDGVVDARSTSAPKDYPTYRWREPGTYRMTLTAHGSTGGSTTVTSEVNVTRAGVQLTASPAPVLTDTPVTLDAGRPALPETGVADAQWDLDGNGSYETDTGSAVTATTTYRTPGTRTVHVRLTREGGAVDEGALDLAVRRRPPAGPVGVSINGGDRFTNDPKVTLDVTWPAGAADVTVANDGGFRAARRLPVAEHVPWTLDESGRERLPKTIHLRFDKGTQTFQDEIVLDQTDPAIQSAQVTAPASASARAAAARRKRSYLVRMRATDRTSGVAYAQFATRRSKPARRVRYHRSLVVRATTRPVYVRVQDRAGNASRWRRLAVKRR